MMLGTRESARIRDAAGAGESLRGRRIGVIYGGVSSEHAVSLRSGAGIIAALAELEADVVPVLIDPSGNWSVGEPGERGYAEGIAAVIELLRACDVSIPALHGEGGEDGTLQGLLSTAGVRFAGSRTDASAIGMNKTWSKAIVAATGLRTAPGFLLRASEARRYAEDPAAFLDRLGAEGIQLPAFIKPNTGGSSIGVTRVTSAEQIPAALAAAAGAEPHGEGAVLIEREIRGREVDLGVLEGAGGELLVGPALEILADPEQPFFDHTAKYASAGTRFEVPAALDPRLAEELSETAGRIFRALGCRGLARIDFFVDETGTPLFNEINTFPGFTQLSQFPRIFAAAGLEYRDIVRVLVLRELHGAGSAGRHGRAAAEGAPAAPAEGARAGVPASATA